MNNQPGIKTIIYDFDGTIADSMSAVIVIYNRMAEQKGFNPITEENREALRGQEPRKVLKELGVSLYQIPKLLLRGRKELKQSVKNLKTQPGIKDVVYKLKGLGYQQGIITTNAEDNVKEFLENNDINIFDFTSSGHSAFGKNKALKKLVTDGQLRSDQTIYVGDEVRDIEAARQAGIKIAAVGWGYNNKTALQRNNPDFFINQPGELLKVVESL